MGVYGNGAMELIRESHIVGPEIPEYDSFIYEEYLNYKNLFENCTDSNERPLLEAKVQVLQEITIKDIWEKIKAILESIGEAIKKFIDKILKGSKEFFKKVKALFVGKKSIAEKIKAKVKAMHESANFTYGNNFDYFTEADDTDKFADKLKEEVTFPNIESVSNLLNNVGKLLDAQFADCEKVLDNYNTIADAVIIGKSKEGFSAKDISDLKDLVTTMQKSFETTSAIFVDSNGNSKIGNVTMSKRDFIIKYFGGNALEDPDDILNNSIGELEDMQQRLDRDKKIFANLKQTSDDAEMQKVYGSCYTATGILNKSMSICMKSVNEVITAMVDQYCKFASTYNNLVKEFALYVAMN